MLDKEIDQSHIVTIANVLNDANRPLKERFRALFTLRNLGGIEAVQGITRCFDDSSALLKHELAYCLGQMQDKTAVPVLLKVLQDPQQEPMVRHEAGEALGAIGAEEALPALKEFCNHERPEIAETCQLAVERIQWLMDKERNVEISRGLKENPYLSVDPTPPSAEKDVSKLREVLLNEKLSLFERYRAMFALRNIGSTDSVLALADGLQCDSALFRHEIAYVLGQMQHAACVPQLIEKLKETDENEMVRHECAEALGSIAADECRDILEKYVSDSARVVRESCEVALDMCEYENSPEFQYADTLAKVIDN